MEFSLQFLFSCLICVSVTWIFHYLIKHQHYYKLAFQLPGVHPFIPSIIAGYVLGPFYKFDAYQLMRFEKGSNNDLYSVWLPKLTVVVKNPEYLSTIINLLDKSVHYDGISYLIGEVGLISCGGNIFRRSKKIFNRGFNASSQEIILDNIYEGTAKLLVALEEKVGKDWFKLAPVIKFTTTNNIMGGAMGTEMTEDNILFTLVEKFDVYMKAALLKTILGKIPFLSSITPIKRILKEARLGVDKFTGEIITQKRKDLEEILERNQEVPNQFIYNILRDREGDPIENIQADIATVAAAALDTSAITSSAALVLLGMYPEMQDKVLEEDRRVQIELAGRKMVDSDFNKYEYLNRVIKETLRLYSSIPIIARHVPEDLRLGQYTLPKGCSVAVYLPYIHRDPVNYPDPSRFDPDRFLPENVEKRHKHAYMPFSHGQRQCPGLRYATQSAVYIVSSIIRKFKVYSKYKTVDEMDDHITGFITLCETGEFPARLELRQQ